MTMLSPHFALAEYLVSETAARRGIDNVPRDQVILDNLRRTAAAMEEVREILGRNAITVTSGYRCPRLNALIGGSANSAHMQGLATDFIAPRFGVPYDICRALTAHVIRMGIDQLIYEHTWVHVGFRDGPPRHEVKTLVAGNQYRPGIILRGSALA